VIAGYPIGQREVMDFNRLQICHNQNIVLLLQPLLGKED
jgi:hypothetical protein